MLFLSNLYAIAQFFILCFVISILFHGACEEKFDIVELALLIWGSIIFGWG